MKRQTFNQFHTISTSIVHRSLSMRSFGLSQVNKIEKSKLVLRKHLFNTEIRYFSADVKNKTQKIDYGKTAAPLKAVKNDDWELLRRKLKHNVMNRGTRENIVLFSTFANLNLKSMNGDELNEFATILQWEDPDLFAYLTDKETPPTELSSLAVYQRLHAHIHSEKIKIWT